MNICEKIVASRRCGEVITGIKTLNLTSVEQAAAQFGLASDFGIYFEVSAREAEAILTTALERDMAYSVELMSHDLAKHLAQEFVGCFAEEGSRFFSNGDFAGGTVNGTSWNPATTATFDTGVLVIAEGLVACAWFMDED